MERLVDGDFELVRSILKLVGVLAVASISGSVSPLKEVRSRHVHSEMFVETVPGVRKSSPATNSPEDLPIVDADSLTARKCDGTSCQSFCAS